MPQSSARTKVALSLVFILAVIGYIVWQTSSGSTPIVQAPAPAGSQPSETTNPNGAPQASGGTPTPTPIGSGTAVLYKDGTYTGQAVDVFYGNVQVKAVVTNGKLADVQVLQYPSDRGHSIEVSNQSLPILTQEAIAAQSAQVDTVSGATQTSEGFKTSLESALTQAKA